ncbi:hypothetical protein PAE9249_04105 [Paenibacillus sp. CECT 9249]|uniref:ABC transporter permease n=1 Tax=Paenibacillus sp. CECT 9249 TaxID=2845385 RepID=UPI001E62F129|nr:ABC transporter permease [Paenibacillus sp. CECT 9249]CAH0121574.1 hypothetical protein PAE9249_04105 [Paenibacillus sp. CECT 9249]
MKRLFQLSSTWFPIWLISLLMLSMISVYLPVFGGDNRNITHVPLIVANEDEGHAGDIILLHLIEQQNGSAVDWTYAKSRKEALNDLKNNKAYGALVIPADYSKRLAQIRDTLLAGNEGGEPATLQMLMNEGIGQSASMIATGILQTVASSVSEEVSGSLVQQLGQKRVLLSPANASLIVNPVRSAAENVLGLPLHLNKGMTPFMMILITSISGIMGANMIHGYLMRGNGMLQKQGAAVSESRMLASELMLGAILALCVSVVLQLAVFGFFGSAHASGIWIIFLYTLFCCLTMLCLFKSLALFFGGWGMLVMFPVNIMGIFSSGGAVPLSTLPVVHRIFSFILPTRYMVDGMRALLYYNGRMQAGLGTALWAITIYFVLTLAIVISFMAKMNRKNKVKAADPNAEKINIQLDNGIHPDSPDSLEKEK